MAKKTTGKTWDRVGDVTLPALDEAIESLSKSLNMLEIARDYIAEAGLQGVAIDGPGLATTASSNARKLASKLMSALITQHGFTPQPSKAGGPEAAKKKGA